MARLPHQTNWKQVPNPGIHPPRGAADISLQTYGNAHPSNGATLAVNRAPAADSRYRSCGIEDSGSQPHILRMLSIDLWTDGASAGNGSCDGGWAALIIDRDSDMRLVVTGCATETTNNRMELMAVIGGLESLSEQASVTVHTDSAYVKNGYLFSRKWRQNGWRSYVGDPVANRDLWERLIHLVEHVHIVKWVKVKGHTNDKRYIHNHLVDGYAVKAKQTQTADVFVL